MYDRVTIKVDGVEVSGKAYRVYTPRNDGKVKGYVAIFVPSDNDVLKKPVLFGLGTL